MKKLSLFKPTKDKILATILVLLAILFGEFFTEILINVLVPLDFTDELSTKSIQEWFNEDDLIKWSSAGEKILIITISVYSIFMYLAASIILTHLKNRKMWVMISAFTLLILLSYLIHS